TPFKLSLPKGPASKLMGGAACNGPVIDGVGSGLELFWEAGVADDCCDAPRFCVDEFAPPC
ncbi:MAG: hypothetical protein WA602_22735, partial [Silvibacterium sp.]